MLALVASLPLEAPRVNRGDIVAIPWGSGWLVVKIESVVSKAGKTYILHSYEGYDLYCLLSRCRLLGDEVKEVGRCL